MDCSIPLIQRLPSAVLLLVWLAAGLPALADEFVLASGAVLQGKLLESATEEPSVYHIQTDIGGRIALAADQVVQVRRQSAVEEEYQSLAAAAPDTATAHWELAQWCRRAGLLEVRKDHLQRVLDLDPQHLAARRALGYAQIGGQWVTQRQFLQARGYVHHKGKWRLPQEVTLLQEAEAKQRAELEWLLRLRNLRDQLLSDQPKQSQAAWDALLAIRDVRAVQPLRRTLQEEKRRPLRLVLVEALGNIQDSSATAVLLATALDDRDQEIFHACAPHLVERRTSALVRALVENLKCPDNERVNRAAYLLGALRDPSAISPLIDALVTMHIQRLPGSRNTTFSFVRPTGGASLAAAPLGGALPMTGLLPTGSQLQGPRAAQAIALPVRNQQVVDALVQLSGGVSFGFNQQAWRHWYATTKWHSDTGAEWQRGG